MNCDWCKSSAPTTKCQKCQVLCFCSSQCKTAMQQVHDKFCKEIINPPRITQKLLPSRNVDSGSNESLVPHRFTDNVNLVTIVTCPVCLKAPALTRLHEHSECATLYCEECLSEMKRRGSRCACGVVITQENCRDGNRHIRELYSKCQVCCINDNCQTQCSLDALTDHEKTCPFGQLVCSLCKHVVTRHEYVDHQNHRCRKRIIRCELCNENIHAYERNNHLSDTCSGMSLPCCYCNESFRRDIIKHHKMSKCELKPIQCPLGCNQCYLRKDMQGHEAVCERRPKTCQYCQGTFNSIDELSRHMDKVCPNYSIQCSNAGCKTLMFRKDSLTHKNECSFRLVKCKHCGQRYRHSCESDHIDKCDKAPIECKWLGCNVKGSKDNIMAHQDWCQHRFVKCDKCFQCFFSKDTKEHQAKCPVLNCNSLKNQSMKPHSYTHDDRPNFDLLKIIVNQKREIKQLKENIQLLNSKERESTTRHNDDIAESSLNITKEEKTFLGTNESPSNRPQSDSTSESKVRTDRASTSTTLRGISRLLRRKADNT